MSVELLLQNIVLINCLFFFFCYEGFSFKCLNFLKQNRFILELAIFLLNQRIDGIIDQKAVCLKEDDLMMILIRDNLT